jgi:hypothetical protein
MRLLIPSLLVLLAAAAPAAAAVRTVADVHTPTRQGGASTAFPVIDAFGGRVVWSDYDAVTDAWRLMEHSDGVTRAVPVAPRVTPFDVDLGPDGRGGTLAVYSRCRRRIPFDFPTPLRDSKRYGCDLYAYSFATGRESALRQANSRADETWPAVWGSRIAFVRTYPGRPGRLGKTPYVYWRSRNGSGRSHRLRRPSPVITIRRSGPEGRTIERRRLPFGIEGLDMRSRTVAYTWQRVDDVDTVTFVYTATTGGALRAAARGATLGGGAADSSRSVGDVSLGADSVDWLFQSSGDPEYFGAFLHRPTGGAVRASQRSKAVAFARDGDTVYWIDGGPGAEFTPASQPGGAFALKADDAVAYGRLPRGWLRVAPPR